MTLGRVGLILIGVTALRGQAPAPAFEVTLVKPNPASGVRPEWHITPGGFRAVHVFLRTVIAEAYGVSRELISGGPSWIDAEAFDIEGKTAEPADEARVKLMLQSLLTDRFKLVLRHEVKELPVSYMTMPKPSPKLVPAKEGEANGRLGWGPTFAFVRGYSMAAFAGSLRRAVGHTVIDRTGIEGEFDVRIETTPDAPFKGVEDAILAVQRELGLKLETTRGPVETLAIESMERPARD